MSKGLCVTATAWQLLAFSQPQLSSTSISSGDASTPNPRPKAGSNPHGRTSPAASWTAAAAAESERIRARERLEASVAALRELQLLREEREASVRQALTRPTTQRQQQQPQRRGKERCYGRGPGRSDGKADDALLAVGRDLELIKEQLQCGLGKPCALERPLSELRVDTDGTDVDSRPSSGFYSMSEDGSLSLSNSCSSISSSGPAPAPHAASTSTPSSSTAAPVATTTMTGQLPVRLRRPAARPKPQERPRSAVELPSFLRTTGQQHHQQQQQQRSPKAKAGPSRPQSSYDLGDGSDARTSPVGLADPVTSAPGRDPDPRFRCDLRSRDGSEVYRYPSPLHAIAMQSSAFLHQRGAGDDRDAAGAAASPDGKPPTGGRTRRHRRHDDAGADDEGSAANAAPLSADKVTAYIAALLKRRGQKTRRRTSGAGASAAVVVERKASDAAKTSASPSAEAARSRPITNLSVRYKHGAAAAASPVPAAAAYGGRAGGAAGSPVGGSSMNLARSPRGGTLPALVRPASIAHFDTSRYHDDDEDDGGGGGDDDERRWRASGPHVHPGAGDRRSSSEKSPNLQQQQKSRQQQQQQSTDRERECRRRALASVSMDLRPQRGAGWWGAAAEPTVGALGWQQGELGRPQYQQRVARICKLGHGSWAGSLPKSLDLRGGYRHRQDDDDDHEDGASDRRHPGNAARSSSSKRHRLREGVELVRQSFRLPGRRRRTSGERASSELDVSGGGRQPTEREEAAGGSTAFDYRRRLVLHPSEVRGIGAGAAGTRAGGHRRWCSTMEIARGGGGGGDDDDDAGSDVGMPPEPPRWLVRAGARDGAWSPSWAVRGHADASPGYPNVYPAAGCPGELLQRSAIAEMSEDDADDADEADGAAGRLPADGSAEPRSSSSAEGLRGPCRVSQQVRAVPSAVKRKIRQRIADAAKTSTDV
ncbi:uncharacterized protein LOC144727403 isoform X2 [Lampetra planeri]